MLEEERRGEAGGEQRVAGPVLSSSPSVVDDPRPPGGFVEVVHRYAEEALGPPRLELGLAVKATRRRSRVGRVAA